MSFSKYILGSLVADAISMPVHWYYDRNKLDRDYGRPVIRGLKTLIQIVFYGGLHTILPSQNLIFSMARKSIRGKERSIITNILMPEKIP